MTFRVPYQINGSRNLEMKFLINTITGWDEPPRARHQIAYALADKYPVVFIAANRPGIPGMKSLHISKHLDVIIPSFPVTVKYRIRIPFLNKLYQKWLYPALLKKYKDYIVINFDFTAKYLHAYFRHTIYYCNDDHIGISYKFNPRFIADYQKNTEEITAQKSVFCVVTSEYLKSKLTQYNTNVFEIRLGAPDIGNFNPETGIQQKKKIHVAFVGFLQTAEINLLNSIIDNERFILTLIGPAGKKDIRKFSRHQNVRMTGKLTGKSLYDEINKCNVGIIPYSLSTEIDRTPNKLWLYLALGKPVVITNIPGIKNWIFPDKFVYKADNADQFSDLIVLAYTENNQSLAEQRMQFAGDNTWGSRINQLIKIMVTFHLNNSIIDQKI